MKGGVFMGKFTTGLIAGGIVGAIGLGYALQDRRFRKKVVKDGRKFANKCVDAYESVADMF
jgi:hypothetical protein